MIALRNTFLAGLMLLFAGCQALGLVPAKTFQEKLAYSDAWSQGLTVSLASATCKKYTTAGTCTESGRPLHPARSKIYLDKLDTARLAIRVSSTMPATGGTCLGQPSTPVDCLALAVTLLTEVETVLKEAKK